MSTYKGKNSLKSVAALGRERATYNSEVKEVTDFNFAEKTLYGRVDRQHNPVFPRANFLKPIKLSDSDQPLPMLLMNFVADQLNDFETYFAKGCQMGFVAGDDEIFSKIIIKKAYEDPNEIYQRHYDDMMNTYVVEYLRTRRHQVHNFKDFGNFFIPFMEQMAGIFPITLSGFQRSSKSHLFTSGLAVDIGGIVFDDDQQKQEKILNSKSYEFFKKTANKYGFVINKRNPGVLVSDVGSLAVKEYLKKYYIYTTNELFEAQYMKTLYHDIDTLTSILLWSYNYFVEINTIKKEAREISGKVKYNTIRRKYINIHDIDNNYIIYLYINIRNIEEGNPFNSYEIKNILETSLRINKKSYNMMLEYIDDQFKSKYRLKDGTLTYYEKKLRNMVDKSC